MSERRPLMVVHWIDSSLQNGQVDVRDLPVPEDIHTAGWLVHEEESHVVLAREDMNNGDWRGLIAIPRECIKATDRV